jgi:hypothetical protein
MEDIHAIAVLGSLGTHSFVSLLVLALIDMTQLLEDQK